MKLFGQAAPFDEPHAQKLEALQFTELEKGNQIGVFQSGRGLSLDPEPFHGIGCGELAVANHLQRDDPVEAHLSRPIHDAHAAASNFLQQLVVP